MILTSFKTQSCDNDHRESQILKKCEKRKKAENSFVDHCYKNNLLSYTWKSINAFLSCQKNHPRTCNMIRILFTLWQNSMLQFNQHPDRFIGAEVTIWNAGQNYIHIDLARFFTCQMPILGSGYVFDWKDGGYQFVRTWIKRSNKLFWIWLNWCLNISMAPHRHDHAQIV